MSMLAHDSQAGETVENGQLGTTDNDEAIVYHPRRRGSVADEHVGDRHGSQCAVGIASTASTDLTEKEPSAAPTLTRLHRSAIFLVLGINGLFSMICLSIMIPFFPTEAAKKDPHPN
eukprot:scpid96943/ scgid33638/ 